jgi:hypothetical protein
VSAIGGSADGSQKTIVFTGAMSSSSPLPDGAPAADRDDDHGSGKQEWVREPPSPWLQTDGRRFAVMNICSDERQRSHFVSIIAAAAAAAVQMTNREIAACLRFGSGVVKNLGIYTYI